MSGYWRRSGSPVELAEDRKVLVYVRQKTKSGGTTWRADWVRESTLKKAGEGGFTSVRSGEKRFADAYRTVHNPPEEVLQQVASEVGMDVDELKQMDPVERAQFLTAHHTWKSTHRKAKRLGYDPEEVAGEHPYRQRSTLRPAQQRYQEALASASPSTRMAVSMQSKASKLEQAGIAAPHYAGTPESRSLLEKIGDAVAQERLPSFEELGVQNDEEFDRMLDMYTQWQRGYEAREAWNRGHYEEPHGLVLSVYYPPLTDDIKRRLDELSRPMEQITESRRPDDAYHRARRYASAIGKAFAERGEPYAVGHIALGNGQGYMLIAARVTDDGKYEHEMLGVLEADGTTLVPRTVHPKLASLLSSETIAPHNTFNTISRFIMETLQRVGGVRLSRGKYFIPRENTAEANQALRLLAAVAKHANARFVVEEGIDPQSICEITSMRETAGGKRPPLQTPEMTAYRRSRLQPPRQEEELV